ncbi:Spy/CpxP family protein refolding chaperone [Paucibacter sp. B2R-40]|uniref:Spy/CpxP family protein refolding chaperone n=1 Tax=Paucibacter sp. B2R-40 TaxID=2893554 RepID=UPI0021E42D50|nr:Spy/CpxP family protein refolding chaperone [Paucibacter sp. B2R-40]MCV2356245.1 Spy/CpxP family protein refolding chaperone [Paucibacter sp. B2R-40]
MNLSNTSKLIRTGKTLMLASVLVLSSLGSLNAQAMGPMGGLGGMGGGRPGMGGPGAGDMMSGGHIEHMLDMVDASDAQRAQIKQIMDAAKQDIKSQHSGGRNLHEQGLALFSAPNIDAAAVEALRVQMSAQHELVSKRMSQAMVDVARVLTPEQRAKLAERMKKMQARMQAARGEHQHAAGKGN